MIRERMIAYGSLMSMAELERYGIHRANACPVTVSGFRRSFSMEPSRRKGVGNKRGVLTVSPSAPASMSAILVSGVSAAAFAALDKRELGYDRISVPEARIQPFNGARPEIDREDVFIYVGKRHQLNSALEPNAEYLRFCEHAACEWGKAFREAFRSTTFVSDTLLAEYPMPSEPSGR